MLHKLRIECLNSLNASHLPEAFLFLKKSITKRRKEFLPCKIHSFQASMLNSDLDLDSVSVFVAYPFEMHAHKKCSIRICHNPEIITLINE